MAEPNAGLAAGAKPRQGALEQQSSGSVWGCLGSSGASPQPRKTQGPALVAPQQPIRNPSRRRVAWLLALATPLLAAPLWVSLTSDLPGALGTVSGLVLLLCLATCTVTDLSCRKIFNWATYSAFAWGIGLNTLTLLLLATGATADIGWLGAVGLKQSIAGAMLCFLAVLVAYSLARGGAGDVKLAAAIGALVGLERGLLAVGLAYILAAAATSAWTVWTRGPAALSVALGRLFGSTLLPHWISPPTPQDQVTLNRPIPLGGFFALGTLAAVLNGGPVG